MFSSAAQSRTEVQSAPDCEMKATGPGLGIPDAKLAFSERRGTMIPRQLGPMIRMPSNLRASCRSRLLEGAAFLPGFAKAGGDDDHAEDSRFAALAHDLGNGRGGGADDGEVGNAREGRDIGVAVNSLYGLHRGMNRVDDPAEAGTDEVAEDRAANPLGVLIRPEKRDPLRLEDLV